MSVSFGLMFSRPISHYFHFTVVMASLTLCDPRVTLIMGVYTKVGVQNKSVVFSVGQGPVGISDTLVRIRDVSYRFVY